MRKYQAMSETLFYQNPRYKPPASSKAAIQDLKDMDVLCTFKIKIESWYSENWCIKVQCPYPNQGQYAKPLSGTCSILQSSKCVLKSMDVLCTFKIKKRNKIQNIGLSKTSDHIQIKIKIPNPSYDPPASPKAQILDLKDIGVLCTFKLKIESQNSEHGCIKDQWPYPNQDQDAKTLVKNLHHPQKPLINT